MRRKFLFGLGAGIYFRPIETLFKRTLLIKEWSRLVGFGRAARMLLFFKFHFLILIFSASTLIPLVSCTGLTIVDNGMGTLLLSMDGESISKGPVRSIPDTNTFILTIKGGGGDTIYNGLYGIRPKELKVEAGTYTIAVISSVNTGPKFDTPIWFDSKNITVEAGSVNSIALLCRQYNGGLRLGFSPEFKTKFSAYSAEVSDSKGSASYSFTEDRFLYLTPGLIYVKMVPASQELSAVPLFSKTIAARDMLTINVRLADADSATFGSGILIDSASYWFTDSVLVGSNDGSAKDKAISVQRLQEYIGLKVWVTGYIVGGDLTTTAIKFDLPFSTKSNLAIASEPGIRDRAGCYSVSLPSGTIQTTFNLVDNPANMGKKVWVKGTVNAKYLGLVGIESTTEFILE
ncbi:MAG: DUF6359 domain-containing protein [Bacteroidales bacterium]